jgi:hypothetical protein
MTYFVSLKIVALVVGLLYLAAHLPGALIPNWTAPRLRGLPRNYPLGVVLMLAATAWFVMLTAMMDLGELSGMRPQLMAVWAIAGVLTVIFVPGFLAIRGFGCLLLLAGAVILDGAFLVETPARFVMTILAYLWVIAGMVLVYSPHLGRDHIMYVAQTPQRCRAWSWPGVILGVVLIVLGLIFYP